VSTADELEKVTYAFLTEKQMLLADDQAMNGKYIQQIFPDWNRIMGWAGGGRWRRTAPAAMTDPYRWLHESLPDCPADSRCSRCEG